MRKVKEFRGLFFRGINKTRNSREIRKVYSKCFIFRGVFRENICEIPVKCDIRKVYSQPNKFEFATFHIFPLPVEEKPYSTISCHATDT